MKIDGITYNNAELDPVFCKLENNLNKNCQYLSYFGTCDGCPNMDECLKLWGFISSCSTMCQLTKPKVEHYRVLFKRRIGVAI